MLEQGFGQPILEEVQEKLDSSKQIVYEADNKGLYLIISEGQERLSAKLRKNF